MFKNLQKLTTEQKEIQRAPRGVNTAAIKIAREKAKIEGGFKLPPSALLQELYEAPELEDLPFNLALDIGSKLSRVPYVTPYYFPSTSLLYPTFPPLTKPNMTAILEELSEYIRNECDPINDRLRIIEDRLDALELILKK